MSATPVAAATLSPAAPSPSRTRRRLEVVEPRLRRRPAVRYAIVCVVAMLAIVVAQLLLSVVLTQGAYQLERLEDSAIQLQREVQISQVQLQKVSSPQSLATRAAALGMVGDGNPVYLRLSDGAILGAPAEGAAPPTGANLVPNALVTPPAPPASPAPGTPASAASASEAGAPGASVQSSQDSLVPWQGELPAPATH